MRIDSEVGALSDTLVSEIRMINRHLVGCRYLDVTQSALCEVCHVISLADYEVLGQPGVTLVWQSQPVPSDVAKPNDARMGMAGTAVLWMYLSPLRPIIELGFGSKPAPPFLALSPLIPRADICDSR